MNIHRSSRTIREYQILIDQSIRTLGGYWRTLSGLARVTEELGEVAELLLAEKKDQTELRTELADVFIISTCLANQFVADLENEYDKKGVTIQIPDLQDGEHQGSSVSHYYQLVQTAGQLAKILNHYDGDKPLKSSDKEEPVHAVITKFHQYLFKLAASLQLDLFEDVERTLKKNLQRDKNRFELTSDPSTESTVTRYMKIKGYQTSQFQQGTRFWGALPWKEDQTIQENIYRFSDTLGRFYKCAHIEGLDGLIIEAPNQVLTVKKLQDELQSSQCEIIVTVAAEADYFLLTSRSE